MLVLMVFSLAILFIGFMCASIPPETQSTLTKRAGLITRCVKSLKLRVIVRNTQNWLRWRDEGFYGDLRGSRTKAKERREQWSPRWRERRGLRKREGRAQLSIYSGLKLKGSASLSSVCGRSGRSNGSQHLWPFWGETKMKIDIGATAPWLSPRTGRLLCPHTRRLLST